MKKFSHNTNIIILTDGEVNDTQQVIEIIQGLKKEKGAKTHTIGVGNGVSHDLIKRGA